MDWRDGDDIVYLRFSIFISAFDGNDRISIIAPSSPSSSSSYPTAPNYRRDIKNLSGRVFAGCFHERRRKLRRDFPLPGDLFVRRLRPQCFHRSHRRPGVYRLGLSFAQNVDLLIQHASKDTISTENTPAKQQLYTN